MSSRTWTTGRKWECGMVEHQGLCMLTSQRSNLRADTLTRDVRKEQRTAWLTHVGSQDLQFDISICWHAPNRLLQAELGSLVDADRVGWSAHWLQRKLKHYLNKLDRKVLKSAHRDKHIKIWRLVTLEYTEGVGWHAHALMATPKGHEQQKIINWATWMWVAELGDAYQNSFVPYLVQASATEDKRKYLNYITKTLAHGDDDKVGTIDLVNTAFPVAAIQRRA
jgi:hypothetical protein